MRSKSASRSRSLSIFESRILLTRRSRGTTAAPSVSGPAQAPRPTSSMPTTTWWPASHNERSTASDGALALRAGRSLGAFARGMAGPYPDSPGEQVDHDDVVDVERIERQEIERQEIER